MYKVERSHIQNLPNRYFHAPAPASLPLTSLKIGFHQRCYASSQENIVWAPQHLDSPRLRRIVDEDRTKRDKKTYGRTLLSLSAENSHEAVVDMLLARQGVDANSKDKYG
jgi:hypothetical protein